MFARLHDGLLEAYWPAGREHVISQYRDLPFDFDPISTPDFSMHCQRTLPQYLAYLRSWSASRRCQHETGHDAVTEIAGDLQLAWGDPGQSRAVVWPLTLLAGRT